MSKKPKNGQILNKAVTMFINGKTQSEICEKTGVQQVYLFAKLNELTCRHPECNEFNPCRAAKRRYGGCMMCTALEDTDFGEDVCPFFKTEKEFDQEFKRTNQLAYDPYELYQREWQLDDEY